MEEEYGYHDSPLSEADKIKLLEQQIEIRREMEKPSKLKLQKFLSEFHTKEV